MAERAKIVKSLDILVKQWIRSCGLEKGLVYTVVESVILANSNRKAYSLDFVLDRKKLNLGHTKLSINHFTVDFGLNKEQFCQYDDYS